MVVHILSKLRIKGGMMAAQINVCCYQSGLSLLADYRYYVLRSCMHCMQLIAMLIAANVASQLPPAAYVVIVPCQPVNQHDWLLDLLPSPLLFHSCLSRVFGGMQTIVTSEFYMTAIPKLLYLLTLVVSLHVSCVIKCNVPPPPTPNIPHSMLTLYQGLLEGISLLSGQDH